VTLRYAPDIEVLRDWLNLGDDWRADDATIETVLAAVESEIDSHCHRTFVAPTGTPTPRIFRAATVPVDGEYITYVDDAAEFGELETSSDRTNWTTVTGWWAELDNEPVVTKIVSESPFSKWIRSTSDWGYPGGPPDKVMMALNVRGAALLDRKDSPGGVAGGNEFGTVYVSRYDDPDFVRLLADFVRGDRVGIG
jgi:hypothetical protein